MFSRVYILNKIKSSSKVWPLHVIPNLKIRMLQHIVYLQVYFKILKHHITLLTFTTIFQHTLKKENSYSKFNTTKWNSSILIRLKFWDEMFYFLIVWNCYTYLYTYLVMTMQFSLLRQNKSFIFLSSQVPQQISIWITAKLKSNRIDISRSFQFHRPNSATAKCWK